MDPAAGTTDVNLDKCQYTIGEINISLRAGIHVLDIEIMPQIETCINTLKAPADQLLK